MYLEKIEIQGFKSFADRTILEFQKPKGSKNSITIIVGPNGSGKSNISDAIKWVLGEQSMKNIRGKKYEDVIFAGSEKRGRLGFAEVSLYLNNEDKTVDIEYAQVVITRRIYRDGQTEYLLNKNPIKLLDLNLLLAKAHFGTRSFSMIGQGMIDSVLLSTPMERKEFFDEAVGVKEFQIKRHQALNKLERTEENLHQANMLLKELTPQMRSLTRQVKKLEKREAVQAGLRDYQHEYYHRIWSELTTTKKKQDQTTGRLDKELTGLQEQLDGKRQELETLEKADRRGQIFNELQSKLDAKNQEKNRLLREMTIIKGRLEVDLEKQGKMNLAWLYRQEEELSGRIIDVQKEIARINKEHRKTATDLKQKKARLDSLKSDIEKHTQSIEQTKSNLKVRAERGPLNLISRKIKELYIVYQKFTKGISKATADNWENIQEQAEGFRAQLNELGDLVANEIDSVKKEEAVLVSEDQELWQIQQELNTFIENHDNVAPDISALQVSLQVLDERLLLKQRDHEQLQQELNRITADLSTQKAASTGKLTTSKIASQQESLDKDIKALDVDITELQNKLNKFNDDEEEKQSRVFQLEREHQEIQQQVSRLQQKKHTIQVELARTETKLEDLETEIRRELGEVTLVHKRPVDTKTDLEEMPTDHLFSQIEKFKYQLELIGGIDTETVEEYEQVKERYDFLTQQTEDLEKALQHLESVITELDKKIVSEFDRAFNKINKEFERYFQILFGGGRAKLIKILPDEDAAAPPIPAEQAQATENVPDEQEEEILKRSKKYRRSDIKGIDIYASPAGKKLATISMLSGGERSLTSLALIAAIIHHNPAPFVMMDEVDAALDEANSQRMAKVLEDLQKQSQFILITHNRTIMNIADTIYGVTMGSDGVSKLLSVKLEEVDEHTTRL